MNRLHFVVPGALDQLTGGYLYDRRIVDELRSHGREVVVHELRGAFPEMDRVACDAAATVLSRAADRECVVIDGAALPAFRSMLPAHRDRLRFVVVHHLPFGAETGLSATERDRLGQAERELLANVHRVVATSPHTAAALGALGVTADRVGVVGPGVTRWTGGRRPPTAGALELLTVAIVIPRKAHAVLVDALGELRDLDWRWTAIGSLRWDPGYVADVRAAIARHRLEDRIRLEDERPPEEVAAAFADADIFVLPSRYESYGMVLDEALDHGLPIVSTRGGAIPETVPPDTGLFVPPDDPAALADALRRVITDPALRDRLATAARRAGAALPTWRDAGRRFAAEIDRAVASTP